MPICHHFYVERRQPEGWGIPADFEPSPWTFECGRPFGEFAWAHPRQGWLTLFCRVDAMFPPRPGPPEDKRGSPLLRHLDRFYDYERNEDQLCWLPYSELFIDTWDTEQVIVETQVQARFALLFGDGQQRFPQTELLGAGVSHRDLENLRNGILVHETVDNSFGRERFQVSELPPDYKVTVTWRATIAEFIGEPHASLFKGLRRYGPDEDLRIIFKRG